MENYYIDNICPFDIDKTLDCGQSFRWHKKGDKIYIGIVSDNVYQITQINSNKIYIETSGTNTENFIREYLGLNYDYDKFNSELSSLSEIFEVVEYSKGIRILNQSHFECLISYIISANNMVPRIMKSVDLISNKFGNKIEFNGDIYYSFPTPSQLSQATLQDLRECGVGFRDKYILECAKSIASGETNLNLIEKYPTDNLRKELIKIKGVGRKVADCVMLYSYYRYEVFPIDVWIKRIMQSMFIKEEVSLNKIQNYASKKFNNLSGLTNIYLFYYARKNKTAIL